MSNRAVSDTNITWWADDGGVRDGAGGGLVCHVTRSLNFITFVCKQGQVVGVFRGWCVYTVEKCMCVGRSTVIDFAHHHHHQPSPPLLPPLSPLLPWALARAPWFKLEACLEEQAKLAWLDWTKRESVCVCPVLEWVSERLSRRKSSIFSPVNPIWGPHPLTLALLLLLLPTCSARNRLPFLIVF